MKAISSAGIEQEVSSVADAASLPVRISARPSIPARSTTQCWSAANETVVVDGLLDKSVSDTADKVPAARRYSVIGALFRSTSKGLQAQPDAVYPPTVIRDRDGHRQASSRQYRL